MHRLNLETLWEAARNGIIDWPSVQRYQASLMPRCINHPDQPMAVYQDADALCAACYIARLEARKEESV